jgi:hypothetical protein
VKTSKKPGDSSLTLWQKFPILREAGHVYFLVSNFEEGNARVKLLIVQHQLSPITTNPWLPRNTAFIVISMP